MSWPVLSLTEVYIKMLEDKTLVNPEAGFEKRWIYITSSLLKFQSLVNIIIEDTIKFIKNEEVAFIFYRFNNF
jgi:hypothetical protein